MDEYLAEEGSEEEMNSEAEGPRFCPQCGGELQSRVMEGVDRLVCRACPRVHYLNPIPAAGVLLTDGREVLLVKRRFNPYKGSWCLPAGFVEYWESAEACARRELEEETGLIAEDLELLGVYAGGDDPRSRVILVIYKGGRWSGCLEAGDDAMEARWFALDAPPEDLAFRAHRRALEDAQERDIL